MIRQAHVWQRAIRRGRARNCALAVLLVIGLAACGLAERQTVTVTATPAHIPAPTPAGAIGPFEFGPDINPLTGLGVDDPAALDRRPLAVKISNAPAVVRPQAGVGAADLVFEHYVEGDLTRFTAIFWTHTPPRVGSVRSARLIDLELIAMYGALFAYSGANEPIRQRIAELPFAPRAYEGVTTGPPLYYRDLEIEAPHNLFTVPTEVWARAEAQGLDDPPPLGGMAFSPEPPQVGLRANRLVIDYGPDVVEWTYDAEAGHYVRAVNGDLHTDALTGAPVTAANVVLVYAHHQPDQSIMVGSSPSGPTFSTEIQIWTLGPATLFRDGEVAQGYWMRWEEEHMLSFWADEAATERLYLKPGNTWFQVVPLDFSGVLVE